MMATGSEFSFSSVELFKGETIGSGAYGAVCKAKCDKLQCAAKLLYNTLLDLQDQDCEGALKSYEHRTPMSRFKQECQFLSKVNHPNIVQYLGTISDPDTKAIVLLMELMNESLTHYLEKLPGGKMAFYMQININCDVALALNYLHNNNIIHRDLSSNNVLLTASHRAKVSDFGMSTILGNTGVLNSLTVCPGNVIYMPPEALDEPPVYANSLDIFSFGVLVVQINSCQFPSPTNRFTTVDIISPVSHKAVSAKLAVPEVERRQEHIQMMDRSSPLFPIVKNCLKDSGSERPSASELCDQFETIKLSPKYFASQKSASTSESQTPPVMSENFYELDDETPASNQPYVSKIKQLEEANETLRERVKDIEQELSFNNQLLDIRARELQKVTRMLSLKEEESSKPDLALIGELKALRSLCHENESEVRHLNGVIEDLTRDNARLRDQIQLQDSTVIDLQSIVDDREDYISSTKAHLLAEMEDNRKLRAQLDKKLINQDSVDEHESLDMWINQGAHSKIVVQTKRETEVKDLEKLISIKDTHITSLEEVLRATEEKLQKCRSGLKPPIKPRASPASPRVNRQVSDSAVRQQVSDHTASLKVRRGSSGTTPEPVMRPRSPRHDLIHVEWDAGVNAPCPIQAGSAAVHDGKVYLRPANRGEIFEYNIEQRVWKELERCPSSACTLVNIGNVLTTVGGMNTRKLWSYVTVGKDGGAWTEIYPQMRVERYNAAVACSKETLVVAGGFLKGWSCISDVEVLDISTRIWFTSQPLPYSIYSSSAAVCNDVVYIVGGYFEKARGHFSVLSCPLANLTESVSLHSEEEAATTWCKVADLPVCRSTCVTFRGKLAVVGGRMVNGCDSSTMYVYNQLKNTWSPLSDMLVARSECHAAVVNDKKVVIAGGCVGGDMVLIDSVEVGEIMMS
jgi:serine/threonine protein kinase